MNTASGNDGSAPSEHWTGLQRRTATALVVLPIAGSVLWLGGWALVAMAALMALQINREWERMTPNGIGWRIGGLAYAALPCLALIALRNLEFTASADAALWATLGLVAMVIATDVGAYFAGKIIGGPKLAPALSPKKTWAGLLGGMAASAGTAVALLPQLPWPESIPVAILLGMGMALLAQAGDLFESWLKRRAGVKDSGSLLPGHGGLMDRLDGYIPALPVYLALLLCYAELLP